MSGQRKSFTETRSPRVVASGHTVARYLHTSATPSASAAEMFSVSSAFQVGAQSKTAA